MKRLLLICFLLSIFLTVTIGGNATYMWSAGTTGEGSIAYVSIGILSEIINTYAGEDIYMTPIAYTSSLAGLRGFDQKQVVSMYCSGQQLTQMINQEKPFDPGTYKWSAPFTQMMWMYTQDHFFIIRKDDVGVIKSYSDLANRPVFPQMLGTGTYENYKVMLGPDGLNIWDTIDKKSFEYGHSADALKLKEVDAIAAYGVGGDLTGFVQEAIARTDCAILYPTPEELEKMLKAAPFLAQITMGPENYGQNLGLTKTISLPGICVGYLVSPDVPEELVYLAIKTAFEHATEMAKSTTIWETLSKDPWGYNLPLLMKFKKMGAPINPGALRYFRELGHNTKLLGLE